MILNVQNIFFFIAPPFSVVFCAGLLWRRANTPAALVTIFTGFAFSYLFDVFIKGQQGVYLHRAFFTWCYCVLVMMIVSLLTEPPPIEQIKPILWTPGYARLPLEERRRYHGIKDFRIWWALFIGIILAIYTWFLWFRFQYPIPMFHRPPSS